MAEEQEANEDKRPGDPEEHPGVFCVEIEEGQLDHRDMEGHRNHDEA